MLDLCRQQGMQHIFITHRSVVKSTTTRASPACLSSRSNSSSLVMTRTSLLNWGTWGCLLSSVLFFSSFTLSTLPLCFSFAEEGGGGGGGGDKGETVGTSVVSRSSLSSKLHECGCECAVIEWTVSRHAVWEGTIIYSARLYKWQRHFKPPTVHLPYCRGHLFLSNFAFIFSITSLHTFLQNGRVGHHFRLYVPK